MKASGFSTAGTVTPKFKRACQRLWVRRTLTGESTHVRDVALTFPNQHIPSSETCLKALVSASVVCMYELHQLANYLVNSLTFDLVCSACNLNTTWASKSSTGQFVVLFRLCHHIYLFFDYLLLLVIRVIDMTDDRHPETYSGHGCYMLRLQPSMS